MSLGKTANQMLQDHVTKRLGHTLADHHEERTPDGGFQCSITVGSQVFAASDVHHRLAKQRASLAALRHWHPDVRMWHELLALYREGDHAMPMLRPRSHTASQILAADRLT
eukprot:3075767-Prymnesium_polylepis.1